MKIDFEDITNQIAYDKVQRAEELIQELLYMDITDVDLGEDLVKVLEDKQDYFFTARQRYDKQRLKSR